MFGRKTSLPPEIFVAYNQVNQLLTPETREKLEKIGQGLLRNVRVVHSSKINELLLTRIRQAFPRATPFQLNIAVNMVLCYLVLQNAMQMESRQFNSVSNALKVRSDSDKAAIRNMK